MANEASVRVNLDIRKGNLVWRSPKEFFQADVEGTKGPTPGALTVTEQGEAIDISELVTPGFCEVTNYDAINYVELGIHDGVQFWPIMEIGPGEVYVIKLSRNLTENYLGTGSGTGAIGSGNLWIKANNGDCNVSVNIFER